MLGEQYSMHKNKEYDPETANVGVGNLISVAVLPADVIKHKGVVMLSGYINWKNWDYGIYYNNRYSVKLTNVVSADNGADILAIVYGSSSVAHICDQKTVEITNSIFIGSSSTMDWPKVNFPKGTYIDHSRHCRALTGPGGEKIGLIYPTFTSDYNNAPEDPCGGTQSYHALCGSTHIKGNIWASSKENFSLVVYKQKAQTSLCIHAD